MVKMRIKIIDFFSPYKRLLAVTYAKRDIKDDTMP